MPVSNIFKKVFLMVAYQGSSKHDRQIARVLERTCDTHSLCADIHPGDGRFLAICIRHCKNAMPYAYEPDPQQYYLLKRKYGSAAKIYSVPQPVENIDQVLSPDHVFPPGLPIKMMKLSIHNGSTAPLESAGGLLRQQRPYIIMECINEQRDLSATNNLFDSLQSVNYQITTLKRFLQYKPVLSQNHFSRIFTNTGRMVLLAIPGTENRQLIQ